jgi:hypothetical protein
VGAYQHQELPRIIGRALDLPLPALAGVKILEFGPGVEAVLFQRARDLFRRPLRVRGVRTYPIGF